MSLGEGGMSSEHSPLIEHRVSTGAHRLMDEICSNGSFDAYGGEILRGRIIDPYSAKLAGFMPKRGKEQVLHENRRLYELRNEVGRIDSTDPYDFALLELCMGQKGDHIPLEMRDEIYRQVNFLGYKYTVALMTARIDEYLEYDTRNRPAEQEQMKATYGRWIDDPAPENIGILEKAIDYIRADRFRNGFDDVSKGWEQSLDISKKFLEVLLKPDSTLDWRARKIAVLIDQVHSMTHNNGSMLNHLTDQSRSDKDTLAVIELEAYDNLHVLWQRSSPSVKEIYATVHGLHFDAGPQGYSIGSPEYFAAIEESAFNLMARNISHGKQVINPEPIMRNLVSELVEAFGVGAVPVINKIFVRIEPHLSTILQKLKPYWDEQRVTDESQVVMSGWKVYLRRMLTLDAYIKTKS